LEQGASSRFRLVALGENAGRTGAVHARAAAATATVRAVQAHALKESSAALHPSAKARLHANRPSLSPPHLHLNPDPSILLAKRSHHLVLDLPMDVAQEVDIRDHRRSAVLHEERKEVCFRKVLLLQDLHNRVAGLPLPQLLNHCNDALREVVAAVLEAEVRGLVLEERLQARATALSRCQERRRVRRRRGRRAPYPPRVARGSGGVAWRLGRVRARAAPGRRALARGRTWGTRTRARGTWRPRRAAVSARNPSRPAAGWCGTLESPY
jgi:hypothetical protein